MKRLVFAAVFILFAAVSTHGTTLVRVPFNEQARRADLVVVGKALRVENTQRQDFPFRRIIISIEEIIAGEASGREIAVVQPGGKRANGAKVRVQGLKYIEAGDEVLLFLRLLPGGDYEIIGLSQGHYPITHEPGTGRKVIKIRQAGGDRTMTLKGAAGRVRAVRANSGQDRKSP